MLFTTTFVAALLASNSFVHAQSLTPAALAYMPLHAACPTDFTLVREAGMSKQALSDGESAYISARKSKVLPEAWKSYLSAVKSAGVALPAYVSHILNGKSAGYPTLGIAQSGGGYRAAIVGAGIMNALDGRNASSVSAGTGGLLQAATYISALSGGNWLLTSLVQADFPTLPDLVFGSGSNDSYAGWLFQEDLFQPNGSAATLIGDFLEELAGKAAMGYPVTFSDFWARALSRHFVNGTSVLTYTDETTTHGAGITFSGLRNVSSFQSHTIPFPLVVADTVSNQQNNSGSNLFPITGIASLTNPIYEMNVYEFGTWDPMLASFIPIDYLGSTNNSVCVTRFDQASFVEATSSALWRQVNSSGTIQPGIATLFDALHASYPTDNKTFEIDASLIPNPFHGREKETFIDTYEEYLTIIDGGDNGENIPFQPLLVKARGVDTIFAIDVSGDEDNFSTGRSLMATQERVPLFSNSYSFPAVPTNESTFVSQKLTSRPTFFGCGETDPSVPLVILVANGAPPPGQPPVTNTSVFQTSYTVSLVEGMMDQAFTLATQGIPSGTHADRDWPACVACAVVDRARERTGTRRSGVCETCFSRYCWNGE